MTLNNNDTNLALKKQNKTVSGVLENLGDMETGIFLNQGKVSFKTLATFSREDTFRKAERTSKW